MHLAEHALIGDCRSAALVDGRGTIDWLCWPRFDSASIFASLLDAERGGLFRVAPVASHEGAWQSCVRYLDRTNVAVTRFHSHHGAVVEVVDLMTVDAEASDEKTIAPEHEILRVARCTAGEATLHIELDPRPAFGAERVRLDADRHGVVRFEVRGALYTLRTSGPALAWKARASGGLQASVCLRAGARLAISLSYARDAPAVLRSLEDGTDAALARTVDVWRSWAERARYAGPYRAAVVRSALALKLLCYSPSGAIVAAPTTSLPEVHGGEQNWDYRFCWLRDAALTTRALYGLGLDAEGDGFVDWLIHATRLTRPALRILYDVFGEQPRAERTVALAGFEGAGPVRVGNAAMNQLQLDVYGEVIDAVAQAALRGRELDSHTTRMLRELGTYVVDHWREPDDGIWEPRQEREHHVHSRALCWVALDRLLMLAQRGAVALEPSLRARFERERGAIAAEIHTQGWNEELGSYVAVHGDERVDAALLLLGWYGFEDPASARMRGTASTIDRVLGVGHGLIRRNLEIPEDGGFVASSFWAVEQLARAGSLEEARARFERLLALASPTGLFAEIVDAAGTHLGNYPQGFSHLALISAAIAIEERGGARP